MCLEGTEGGREDGGFTTLWLLLNFLCEDWNDVCNAFVWDVFIFLLSILQVPDSQSSVF